MYFRSRFQFLKEKLANLLQSIPGVVLMLSVDKNALVSTPESCKLIDRVGSGTCDLDFADFRRPLPAALLDQLRFAARNGNLDGPVIQRSQTPRGKRPQSFCFRGQRGKDQRPDDSFISSKSANLGFPRATSATDLPLALLSATVPAEASAPIISGPYRIDGVTQH